MKSDYLKGSILEQRIMALQWPTKPFTIIVYAYTLIEHSHNLIPTNCCELYIHRRISIKFRKTYSFNCFRLPLQLTVTALIWLNPGLTSFNNYSHSHVVDIKLTRII